MKTIIECFCVIMIIYTIITIGRLITNKPIEQKKQLTECIIKGKIFKIVESY